MSSHKIRGLRDAKSCAIARDGAFGLVNIGFFIASRKKDFWYW